MVPGGRREGKVGVEGVEDRVSGPEQGTNNDTDDSSVALGQISADDVDGPTLLKGRDINNPNAHFSNFCRCATNRHSATPGGIREVALLRFETLESTRTRDLESTRLQSRPSAQRSVGVLPELESVDLPPPWPAVCIV